MHIARFFTKLFPAPSTRPISCRQAKPRGPRTVYFSNARGGPYINYLANELLSNDNYPRNSPASILLTQNGSRLLFRVKIVLIYKRMYSRTK